MSDQRFDDEELEIKTNTKTWYNWAFRYCVISSEGSCLPPTL